MGHILVTPTKYTLAKRMRAYSRTKVRPQWCRRERVSLRVASASMGHIMGVRHRTSLIMMRERSPITGKGTRHGRV